MGHRNDVAKQAGIGTEGEVGLGRFGAQKAMRVENSYEGLIAGRHCIKDCLDFRGCDYKAKIRVPVKIPERLKERLPFRSISEICRAGIKTLRMVEILAPYQTVGFMRKSIQANYNQLVEQVFAEHNLRTARLNFQSGRFADGA